MRNTALLAVVIAALALPAQSFVHGGGYNGPPPTDPGPPANPGGPNPPPPATPTPPTPGLTGKHPSTPAPAGPKTPGPGNAGPSRPKTPAGAPPAPPAGSPGVKAPPRTGAPTATEDLTQWQYWWAVNQAPYLQLKSHIHAGGVITGSDEYWLGRGQVAGMRDFQRVSALTIKTVILPELLRALRTESSNDIQSSCMVALAKIGNPDAERGGSALFREGLLEIRKRLTSSSQELAETAAVSLGITGDRENIPVLTALLENDLVQLRSLGVPQFADVDVRTRAFAAYGLGLIGNGANGYDRLVINATLRKLLDGEGRNMAHRDVPVACLTAIGLTPLSIDSRDGDLERSKKARINTLMTSRQDQLRFLLDYYADDANNSLTRAQAPTAMARLLADDRLPAGLAIRSVVAKVLMGSLAEDSKDDNSMQQSAILALGRLADCDEDALDVSIRATLMDVRERLGDQQSRHFALIALAQAAGHAGNGLGDPIFGVNVRDPKRNARSYLLGELARDRGPGRPWAGLAVAIMERALEESEQAASPDSKLALRAKLEEARSPDDLGAFAIACGLVRDNGACELLRTNLDSVRDDQARGFNAVALGLLDDREAIAPIQEIASASKYRGELLRSLAIALGLLGDKQVVPDLIVMLSKATSLSSQAAISAALGTIGDSRSIAALVELLHSTEATDLARAFGATALGIVADKEDLPWNSKIGADSNYRANTPSLTNGTSGILDIL